MTETKRCTACGERKALDAFGRDKRTADGLRLDCKSCVNAYHRAYYAAHREQHQAANRRWRETHREQWNANCREAVRRMRERRRAVVVSAPCAQHAPHGDDGCIDCLVFVRKGAAA